MREQRQGRESSVGGFARRGRWLRWVVVLAAVAVAVAAGSLTARAGPGQTRAFSDWSLAGRWGFSASGIVVPPAVPGQVPAAGAGIMSFDGHGGCWIADTINVAGTARSRVSTSCSYSVRRNGRGTVTAVFPDEPAPVPLSFVLIRKGSAFRFIRADGVVAEGVAERQ
jgi:hypothetical protein